VTGNRPASSIVRVRTADGTAGLGVLVGRRQILTCAHVVNLALGRDRRAQEAPDAEVTVEFPLLRGGRASSPVSAVATVTQWLPPPRSGVAGDDIAELFLAVDAPEAARPARFAAEVPPPGSIVDVFGYPATPPRPQGAWVEAAVRGLVNGGLLQLDSTTGTALQAQGGYSGSPVCDRSSGRVIGLLSAAPAVSAQVRDSYAVTVDRLRLALSGPAGGQGSDAPAAARSLPRAELSILHLSDLRFGHVRPGSDPSTAAREQSTLFATLVRDLGQLENEGLRPDLVAVTGDLTERGLPEEFEQARTFLTGLVEAAGLRRRHVALVPGNHDVNRKLSEGYFLMQAGESREVVRPYWPKWRPFAHTMTRFYDGIDGYSFTPDEPWTLFEMPDLAVVVAGLNSTMADSHRDEDHHGWLGENQLTWFAERLADYRERGWFRLVVLHHNTVRSEVRPDRSLADVDSLERVLGASNLVNLVLHSYAHDAQHHVLGPGVPVLSTGSSVHPDRSRLMEAPRQYQVLTVHPGGLVRFARAYRPDQRRWVGDTSVSPSGSSWQVPIAHDFAQVATALAVPDPDREPEVTEDGPEDSGSADPQGGDDFLERVREATAASHPTATISVRGSGGSGYLRVAGSSDGIAELWPVGVVDGEVTEKVVSEFVRGVHSEFAAADPQVRSRLVYSGPPVNSKLVARARSAGVRLCSFVEYQGLLDLRPLAENQLRRLTHDREWPSELYVQQRFRVLDGPEPERHHDRLLDQVTEWLDVDGARFVMLLGEFGRGKTFVLREITRQLTKHQNGPVPILVELRGLEKAPTLDELLAQHLVRHGVESVELPKLRYMVTSGRLVLLFDGFDELALRVSYDHAADYLRTLLDAVTGHAKIVLTSRTQHFQSTKQVRTALGDWVSTMGASRVAELGDFSPDQIREFLVNRYGGDRQKAADRYELLASVHDLLGLSANPRMLSFMAGLDTDRLREVIGRDEKLSAAELYRDLVNFWLGRETERQRHGQGLLALDVRERLTTCIHLALRLWTTAEPAIHAQDMAAEVAARLTKLAERGYSTEQATHAMGSSSLLVRGDDGAFSFVHDSVMEWLVAEAAAESLRAGRHADVLDVRMLTPQMAEFLCDLAGHEVAGDWAENTLRSNDLGEAARKNALQIDHFARPRRAAGHDRSEPTIDLHDADLRGQDLSGRSLVGANLRGANLSGARLVGADLTGADLTGADLTGARLVRVKLDGAIVTDVRWRLAGLLSCSGVEALIGSREAQLAAIAPADAPQAVVSVGSGLARCVAISPRSLLIAYGLGNTLVIADLTTGQPLRVLTGHADGVAGVAFSPDGEQIATASYDQTARIWSTSTGETLRVLTGHTGRLYGIAYSPDGAWLATASRDRTARLWDVATGAGLHELTGHTNLVYGVAFGPTGPDRVAEPGRPAPCLVATASFDRTARLWDAGTGELQATLSGHTDEVYGVAFSPEGTLLATASYDRTARIWDVASRRTRAVLDGHSGGVSGVAFSPDGALVATSSRDRTARIWDTASGRTLATLTGHAGGVSRVVFSPDGSMIATASRDRTARIWDTTTWTTRSTLGARAGGVAAVAFSSDGELVASTWDNTTRVWERRTGRSRFVLAGHTGAVTGVAFSPDGRLLVTGSRDRTARMWATADGRLRAILEGHTGGVAGVAFSPDGELVATASYDRTARLWAVATGRTRAILAEHAREVSTVAFSPDGSLVATASYDRTVRICRVATGDCLTVLDQHAEAVHAVAFGPVAGVGPPALVATATRDGTVSIWEVATGRRIADLAGHTGGVAAVAFSPDGRLLATASSDNTARLWEVATATETGRLVGHQNWVSQLAFSTDGTVLATASLDNTVRLWHVGTRTEFAAWLALPGEGCAVMLPDGGYKLNGDGRDVLWWAIKLCRFAPGELDEHDPRVRREDWARPLTADGSTPVPPAVP
jgi:WD40 repeat protein/3',5'-cyclic AMP phosphodiesterase CpdA